jgi:hypothetical protein
LVTVSMPGRALEEIWATSAQPLNARIMRLVANWHV